MVGMQRRPQEGLKQTFCLKFKYEQMDNRKALKLKS
jgi:hypothetical protein